MSQNLEDLYADPMRTAESAAEIIRKRSGVTHDVALVMGSGWIDAVALLTANGLGEESVEIPLTDLPGFPSPKVEGHGGSVKSLKIGDKNALVFLGRTHLYEGLGIEPVAHGVRTAVKAGAKIVILTNACGGINTDYKVGQPVLIKDHISLTGVSPLIGANFVDLTDLYSARLRGLARSIDPTLSEGVYAHWRGPAYETPAEIRMMHTMGADLVGMSTVPEAIAAHALGAEVMGISLVTNAAAGVTGAKLDHHEVIAAGKASAERMGILLRDLIRVV
ncbi:MAG TPA: purine-nucleoside phosphorylase [Candidatus Nanopelagicaceae bacterium]|nr:purine-nucleoside phosphorylase [Candidatus Nanopelagicaceae bacterium]